MQKVLPHQTSGGSVQVRGGPLPCFSSPRPAHILCRPLVSSSSFQGRLAWRLSCTLPANVYIYIYGFTTHASAWPSYCTFCQLRFCTVSLRKCRAAIDLPDESPHPFCAMLPSPRFRGLLRSERLNLLLFLFFQLMGFVVVRAVSFLDSRDLQAVISPYS